MTQEKKVPARELLPPIAPCCAAEVLGTFLLIFFGCGAVHVAVLLEAVNGLWQVGIVWGVSIMLAVYVVGAVSGAHINPAITIGLALGKLFPSRRIAPYVLSQVAGAFLAAAVLFTVFHPHLAAKEKEKDVVRGEPGSEITAMCYGEYFPNPGALAAAPGEYSAAAREKYAADALVSEPAACIIEIIGTAILALVVVAVTDTRNVAGPGKLAPVFIGLTVAALIVVIAPLTQACLNPARDFGPRLFAYFAGWGAIALPGPRPTGFLTVYILSPIVGAIAGVTLYQKLIQPFLPATTAKEVANGS